MRDKFLITIYDVMIGCCLMSAILNERTLMSRGKLSSSANCKYLLVYKLQKCMCPDTTPNASAKLRPSWKSADRKVSYNDRRHKSLRNFALLRNQGNFISPLVFADSFRQIGLAVYLGFCSRIHEREQSVRDGERVRDGGGGGNGCKEVGRSLMSEKGHRRRTGRAREWKRMAECEEKLKRALKSGIVVRKRMG